MKKLEGFQRKYLRGVAHGLKPVVFIGQKGLTPEVLSSAEKAFERHELIKVKFNAFKEKEEKTELSARSTGWRGPRAGRTEMTVEKGDVSEKAKKRIRVRSSFLGDRGRS